MCRVGVEEILGITRHGASLAVAPCIPSSWPRFEVTLRLGEGTLHVIEVENPAGRTTGVSLAEPDNAACRPTVAGPLARMAR